jgi:hypothetical protein
VEIIICVFCLAFAGYLAVINLKSIYKISYYETKLRNRGVDIDHVKNISFWEILK